LFDLLVLDTNWSNVIIDELGHNGELGHLKLFSHGLLTTYLLVVLDVLQV
jgi:hypothetical protein